MTGCTSGLPEAPILNRSNPLNFLMVGDHVNLLVICDCIYFHNERKLSCIENPSGFGCFLCKLSSLSY